MVMVSIESTHGVAKRVSAFETPWNVRMLALANKKLTFPKHPETFDILTFWCVQL